MKLKRTHIVRALSVIYLLIFLALALYDEPLQSDVAEFLKPPPVTLPDAENAYFVQLGFSAPPGADIHSYGMAKYRKIIDEASKKRAQKIKETSPKDADSGQISFKGKDLPNDKFYQFMTEQSNTVDKMAKENAELLLRYRTLKLYRKIAEPNGGGHYQDVPTPSFSPIRNTHSLTLLLALRSAEQGKIDEALSLLADDMSYWRAILRQSHLLVVKMISIACMQRNYQLLSELIAHYDLSSAQRIRIRELLPPWKVDDLNFIEAARQEALYVTEFLSLIEGGVIGEVFIKKRASTNKMIRFHIENARLSKLTAEDFIRSQVLQKKNQKEMQRLHSDFLYNPVGAILGSIAVPQLSTYFFRFHNLEAKRRMVLIHLMAREQGIGHDGMAEFIKKSGVEYPNPYTGQPMQWDAGKKSILIDSIPAEGIAEHRRVELAL